jgi:hypothetical protein
MWRDEIGCASSRGDGDPAIAMRDEIMDETIQGWFQCKI